MRHRAMSVFGAGVVGALIAGWFAFPLALYSRVDQPLQFSHRLHTGEKVGLGCEECHALSAGGRFSGIPRIEKCATCHAEVQGSSRDETRLVEDYVKKGREIPWLTYSRQPESVFFPHAPHLKLAEIKCEHCHGPHGQSEALRPFEQDRISSYSRDVDGRSIARWRQTGAESMTMDDCSRCHREHGVRESCLTCHK